MALPTSGPHLYTASQTYPSSAAYISYVWAQRHRQARPYNLALPYEKWVGRTIQWNQYKRSCAQWMISSTQDNQAAIRAWDWFLSKMRDDASLGIAIAEYRQSAAMINNRVGTLLRVARHVRRGNIPGALNELQATPTSAQSRRLRRAQANPADLYLEFHFGWSPLVGDIYNAIDVLQSPLRALKVSGGGRVPWSYQTGDPNLPYSIVNLVRGTNFVKYGAEVAVENPNLHLANQLGLVNPAVVVWETVPFSFVLDWFVNVSSFLSQGTDLIGLRIANPYTTVHNKAVVYSWFTTYTPTYYSLQEQAYVKRSNGHNKPTLGLRAQKVWHWRRAAAAVSLLVQRLSRF